MFSVTGLGEVKWVLSMLIKCDRPARTISISQEVFIDTMLTRFGLTDTTPVTMLLMLLMPNTHLSADSCRTTKDKKADMVACPYRELVGALAWVPLSTHPDIAYTTSPLACYSHNPGQVHWEAAKHVLYYLRGTKGH